jgi:glycosyltransferase involved in cell wall biosynthesis
VEPQDAADYQQAYPGASRVLLERDNQGIGYARRAVLAHARATGLAWYWMLDDDITAFYQVVKGRNVKVVPSAALAGAQALFADRPDVAQAALEYQQFAWSARRPLALNSYCDVAVCIHAGRTRPITYRSEVDMKEDRDFTLQVLAMGYRSARVCCYAFGAPKNGSNAGGLHDVYATDGREAQASRRMAELWPGVCRPVVKPDGRHDVAIDWKLLGGR